MLVDTHCHLGDTRFDADRAAVVDRARAAGVSHIVIVADTVPASETALGLARTFGLSATAGIHPHEAASWDDVSRARLEELLEDPAIVAVGETGLDYHYEHAPRDTQRRAFAEQLQLAARTGKPAVVHCRDADHDMAAMLRDAPPATIVLHSFSAGHTVFRTALERGAYVSFSGMVTFRSWSAPDIVTAVPPDRLLVETDAPYLSPVPHRGRRNEPAHVVHVAARVAELRGQPAERVADLTTANAVRCFGTRVRGPGTPTP